jgi:YD repeat-containing protein
LNGRLPLNYEQFGNNNELANIVRPDGAVIQYQYDTSGNLTEVDKPGNGATVPSLTTPSGTPPPSGDFPESYELANAPNSPDIVCGPRETISSWAYSGPPRDGACVSFTLNADNQLGEWQTNGVLNINPGSPDNTGFLQSGPATGWASWDPVTFNAPTGNYSWPLASGNAVTEMSDADGHDTKWRVDSSGRPIEIAQFAGNHEWLITTESWDNCPGVFFGDAYPNACNDLTGVIDPRGNASASGVVYPGGASPNQYETDFAYDTNGNTTVVSLPQVSANTTEALNQTSGPTIRPTSTYVYDPYNNVVAYCDAQYNAQHGVTSFSVLDLCPTTGSGTTLYAYDYTDTNEPYGRLTSRTSPTAYVTNISYYDGSGNDYGQVYKVVAKAAISQSVDSNGYTSRTPTQTFTYDTLGNLSTYSQTDPAGPSLGQWTLGYDPMNRVTTIKDPDSITSYKCYNLDGSVLWTETAYQHSLDASPSCPVPSTLQNGSVSAPTNAVSYTYDPDGDVLTETHNHGGAYSSSGTPTAPSSSGVTKKFYDGLDRLVEVIQPHDGSADVYTGAWMTRYLYDLTQGGSVSFGVKQFAAFGNLFATQEYLPADAGATGYQSLTMPTSSPGAFVGQLVPSQWASIKGTAFDAANRPVKKYAWVTGNTTTETLTYDMTPDAIGMLSQDCNTAAQTQCMQYNYDNAGREALFASSDGSSPTRSYLYDPDGRVASIASGPQIQSYSYDADGRLAQSQDPGGSGTDGGAIITHHYYAVSVV